MRAWQGWLHGWLSFDGRLSRKGWWLQCFLPFTLLNFLIASLANLGMDARLGGIVTCLLIWPWLACSVRRMHDLGLGDRWAYYFLLPGFGAVMLAMLFYNALDEIRMTIDLLAILHGVFFLVAILVCGAMKGVPGANAYGPDPLRVDPVPAPPSHA
jgi:uncharacterized membrane protein YhaH (DUF805 family)